MMRRKSTQMMAVFVLVAIWLLHGAVTIAGEAPSGIDEYDLQNRVNRKIVGLPDRAPEMPPAKATIAVDMKQVVGELGPQFIGYNIEDLSHEIFPGLYAQMLYGESFEDEPDVALPDGWQAHLEPINEDTPNDPDLLRKWRGAWSFEDGVLTMVGCRQRRIWTDRVRMAEGTIECEVLQPGVEPNYWGPGILTCWRADGYYYIYLSPQRKVVVLARGSERNFVQGAKELACKQMPLEYDRWYKVGITMLKDRIVVKLDGQEVINHPITQSPAPGGVGLDSSSSMSCFRNLRVTPAGEDTWKADFLLADRPYSHAANISRWWDPVITGAAQAKYKWEKDRPYNTDRCQLLEMTGGSGTVGVANTGLHNVGICVRQGWQYQGRLYLRGRYDGQVTLALQSRDGSKNYATQKLGGIGDDWKRFDIAMTAAATDPAARFALWIDKPGKLYVDQVVLMPGSEGLYKGQPVRKDLAEKMVAGIGHIRFGGDMINCENFNWRRMTRPQDQRRQYLDGWNYHKSAQFMIFEFLDFCRAAGVEPVINLGEHLPAKEIADFVEYCNGDASSAGGRQRTADGHPDPYGLRWIMYGNGLPPMEEAAKLPAMLEKIDPKVKLILGDVGHVPWVLMSRRDPNQAARLNAFLDKLEAVSSRPEVQLLGSHLLWDQTMTEAAKGFPSLGRSAKLYAEEINGGEYNWRRGLCDALAAIASENHGNLVWGMAYCNALQANGHLYEWNQGHIHFTPAESWYQPSGHVVKMLGEHFQPVVVKTEVTGPRLTVSLAGERGEENVESSALVACAAQSRDGKRLAVKVVSLWGGEVSTSLTLAGTTPPAKIAVRAIGSMHLAGRNTVDKQDYIAPHGLAVPAPSGNSILVKLPPMSFTIIEVQWRD